MGKTEVTQGQWKAVMDTNTVWDANPSHFTGSDDLPVENVSLDDVRVFIRRLNRMTGKMYRLPTEKEWEYAARGGKRSKGYKYSGSDDIDSVAWYYMNSGGKTHPVGTKQPNELGLYDMSGNVMEWTNEATYLIRSIGGYGRNQILAYVIRGGSWYLPSGCGIVYNRSIVDEIAWSGQDNSNRDVGFRLALSAKEPEPAAAAPDSAGINTDMVFVEGGVFMMGCTPEQDVYFCNDMWRYQNRGGESERRVIVDDFLIGKTEVTYGLWNAVMGKKPSLFKRNDSKPVKDVDISDIQEFILKLNEKTGKVYRLPTEREWEYAARGGNKSNGYRYSGSDNIGDVAWYRADSCAYYWKFLRCYGGNSGDKTHPVGAKRPNELGLYDMSGNVMELIINEERFVPDTLFRGGNYYCPEWYCRVSYYETYLEDEWKLFRPYMGFRLAMSPDKPARSSSPPDVSSNPDSIAMVFVEGGTLRKTAVAGFYLGKYEVTQGLWKSVIRYNLSETDCCDDNFPVEIANADDFIKRFIKELNEKTGKKYRLPTEIEWEYAAGGGNKSKGYKYSGSNNIDEVAWYRENSCTEIHPVGTKLANELGLHDMSGSVSELTSAVNGYYNDRKRGGGRFDRAEYCLISFPGHGWREYITNYYGFRLALDP
jgi:formylglycine-generating enzyme required for sulfatase activity